MKDKEKCTYKQRNVWHHQFLIFVDRHLGNEFKDLLVLVSNGSIIVELDVNLLHLLSAINQLNAELTNQTKTSIKLSDEFSKQVSNMTSTENLPGIYLYYCLEVSCFPRIWTTHFCSRVLCLYWFSQKRVFKNCNSESEHWNYEMITPIGEWWTKVFQTSKKLG